MTSTRSGRSFFMVLVATAVAIGLSACAASPSGDDSTTTSQTSATPWITGNLIQPNGLLPNGRVRCDISTTDVPSVARAEPEANG